MMNECIICSSSDRISLYDGILKCQKCGHIFSDLNLNDDELFNLYRKNYFFGDEYSDYLADRNVLQKSFQMRLKVLESFMDQNRHKHLLEIGCAYGFFLQTALDSFDTVEGIDITEDGVHYAKEQLKLNVVHADFLQHDFKDKNFDVVCMWDTIEHLRCPHLYLKKISKHMKGGSLIAITTGDIGSLNARMKKDKWRLMHPPTHIHYFTKKTLAKILDANGFDIIYNRYCGFYRSVDLIAYRILVLQKKWPKVYTFLCKCRMNRFNFYLNLYDIRYVIARKR
ncbi:MAG: class I SAM-dependent methyltransferase [Candidatus Brocadiaceae bacterium]|nr:class I SAM-dependent methyltransferase [Candidatus Brocadiaceae bacterium]